MTCSGYDAGGMACSECNKLLLDSSPLVSATPSVVVMDTTTMAPASAAGVTNHVLVEVRCTDAGFVPTAAKYSINRSINHTVTDIPQSRQHCNGRSTQSVLSGSKPDHNAVLLF